MSNPWFRLYAEFSNDPKVQMLSEQDQRRLIMVFCMRCNGSVTLHDKHVTFQLRITTQEWGITKALFIENGFIDADNNVLNWDKRQYISDSSAARVARHRTLHKDGNVTPVTLCNVTVTPPEQNRTDTEQNRTDKKTTRISSLQKLLNMGVNEQIAKDWLTIRKTKKLPLTDTALEQIRKEAESVNRSLPDIIEVCAKNNWGSFKAKWEIPVEAGNSKPFDVNEFMKKANGL